MYKYYKELIENNVKFNELSGLIEKTTDKIDKSLIFAYFYLYNGNYQKTLEYMKNAQSVMKKDEFLNASNIMFSWADGCLDVCICTEWGCDISEDCIGCCEGCGCCGLPMMLVCGALFSNACMDSMGMEGSCCWDFCSSMQDCFCGCLNGIFEGTLGCLCSCCCGS